MPALPDAAALFVGEQAVAAVYLGGDAVWTGETGPVTEGPATLVENAVGEWWVYPQATYVSEQNATFIGGIGGDGQVTANRFDHAAGTTTRVHVGDAVVDDHCRPALWVKDGHRPVITWTNHGADNDVHCKVGAVNDIESLVDAVDQPDDGGSSTLVAYTQLHWVSSLSDATNDVFYMWSRHQTGTAYTWRFRRLTVNQTTGAVTWGTLTNMFSFAASQQGYVTAAPATRSGNQSLRFAMGYNPKASTNDISYCEVDFSDGAVYNQAGTGIANIYTPTGLPIDVTTLTQAISASGFSLRLLAVRPGPADPAILWGRFSKTAPNAGTYKLSEMTTPGTWNASIDFGDPGLNVGEQRITHYIAGGTFPNPCPTNDVLYLGRGLGSIWSLERRTRSAGTWGDPEYLSYDNSGLKLSRPECPLNQADGGPYEVIATKFSDYGQYDGGYVQFAGDFHAITGDVIPFPPVPLVAPVIVTDGTPVAGETLTTTAGTWDNDPLSITSQWYRNGVAIPGATSTSYLLDAADVEQSITYEETATNAADSATSMSDAIVPTAPPGPNDLYDTFTVGVATVLSSHAADSGQAWSKIVGGASNVQNISPTTNTLRGASSSLESIYRSAWVPNTADYFILVKFVPQDGTSGMRAGIRGVQTAGTDAGSGVTVAVGDGYYVYWNRSGSPQTLRLVKRINGGADQIIAEDSFTTSSPLYVELRAVGTLLTVRYGALPGGLNDLLSVTDTDLTAKGNVVTWTTALTYTTTTRVHIDELQAVSL